MTRLPKIKVENVLQPGKTYSVDPAKFAAMKSAILQVAPTSPPGMTPAEIQKAVLPILPQDLFPDGEKVGWWMKSVQLDQEAKKVLSRSEKPPVRLWKS